MQNPVNETTADAGAALATEPRAGGQSSNQGGGSLPARCLSDLREGMMVRHISRGGGMGIGRVVAIKRDGAHVEFRDKRVRGMPALGIYDENWFSNGKARLEILQSWGRHEGLRYWTEADRGRSLSWLRSAKARGMRHPRLPIAPSLAVEHYCLDHHWILWIGAAQCYGLTAAGKTELPNHGL